MRRDFIEANDTVMRKTATDCQLAEIIVDRHENPFLTVGDGENLSIAGIFLKLACPPYIDTGCLDFGFRRAPDTSVTKNLQATSLI